MRIHLIAVIVLAASTAGAVVLGGGDPSKDCRTAFGAVDATDGQSGVVCTSGDPSCDHDGLADGTCLFTVRLCVGVPLAGCDPIEIEEIDVHGLPLARPPLPSSGYTCGRAQAISVPVGTVAAGTTIALSGGAPRDVDYLNLCCRTMPGPLDASRCAVSIDPKIAGCTGPAVAVAERQFALARDAVERAIADPNAEKAELRRAVHVLERTRRLGHRIAAFDPCGDALALVASHAVSMITGRR
ncbi:MAG TPA: hypothetical protein VKU61_03975 [Candidatus Binatia bacterium]|nr:hypothetical protein [Candidatus Binatia bacterium]